MAKNDRQFNILRRSWLILFLVLLTAGGIGTAVAKYIQSTGGKALFKAPEFYFSSNLLAVEPETYVFNSQTREVSFILRNSADALRTSEMDITYTVTVEENDNNTDENATVENGSGTLFKGGDPVTVSLKNMRPGVTYTVQAKAEAGYKQTLSAVFTVAGKDENIYKHLENSPDGYLLLTVWTQNREGMLAVGFPNALIPDNTNADMAAVYNKNSSGAEYTFNTTIGKYSSKTFRFFPGGGGYTADDFDVMLTENNQKAQSAELP